MTTGNILVVEDEPRIRHFLRMALEGEGIRVIEACSIASGITLMGEQGAGLVILDLGLPDGDGIDFIRAVRDWSNVPILVLSARNLEADKVTALDAGADDYLAKPFGVAELLARVRALKRRRDRSGGDEGSAVVSFGDVVVDRANRLVMRAQQNVHLTPREYHLLTVLLSQPGKVITQRQLLRDVWGAGHSEDGHYVRIYIGRLRQKLETDPTQPKHIVTETGVGYRFVVN